MRVEASGMLRHHFWGEYCATIGLQFSDGASASDALTVLGGSWKASTKPHIVLWHGDSASLESVKAQLVGFGADGHAIDSVDHSVDHGDPFEVTIPVVPAEQCGFDFIAAEMRA